MPLSLRANRGNAADRQGKNRMADYDLAIIGGGINGAGIARDAAGRGLRVLLVEQHDLASATSSASTKLIHGGLRYLEHYAFRLVREALIERERLLRLAPHLIRPLRFVLPHHSGLRPAWLLRLGLFLYDHLGGRKLLPATRDLDLRNEPAGAALKSDFTHGFEYSDCWVDDARLVVLNAMDAAERGATVRTRTRCAHAKRVGGRWHLTLQGRTHQDGATARALINAAGPWVAEVGRSVLGLPSSAPVRLVKGSHIVVPKLFEHDCAYIFQGADGRIVFAIPYEGAFTLIGTTDIDYTGDPAAVAATPDEARYLCGVASDYFRTPVQPSTVVWSYSGVRPLYDDGASKAKDATRDYVLDLDVQDPATPLLSVYGGKITTYRRLAETALSRLRPYLPVGTHWTDMVPLPGGDFAWDGVPAQVSRLRERWPFVPEDQALRLVRAYGTRVDRILGEATSAEALGPYFGILSAAEIRYLIRYEWVAEPEDILWRRSKLGLVLSPSEQAALAVFLSNGGGRKAAG
jgi:glycerol-3-phosphate dehydrogenase